MSFTVCPSLWKIEIQSYKCPPARETPTIQRVSPRFAINNSLYTHWSNGPTHHGPFVLVGVVRRNTRVSVLPSSLFKLPFCPTMSRSRPEIGRKRVKIGHAWPSKYQSIAHSKSIIIFNRGCNKAGRRMNHPVFWWSELNTIGFKFCSLKWNNLT